MMKKFQNVKCYSFEPLPETYERIKKNFSLNNLFMENIINVGLSDYNGEADFYFDNTTSGAASMRNLLEKEEIAHITCTLRKLDDVVLEYNITNIDFIKIDIEGSELFALKGGYETLCKFKPVVFCEILRKWSAKYGYHPNDILKLMFDIGYKCFVIENGNLVELYEVTENTVQTNYFFLEPEKHKRIIEACI